MVSFDDLIPTEPVQPELTRGQRKKAEAEKYMKRLGAGITGAADAASFGLGDEIMAGLSSWPAYLTDKVDFHDLYAKTLEKNRQGIKSMEERNPNAFLAGQVAGAVGTGALGATTKGGAALANSLRTGGLGMRAAKAGALGAAASGAAGFGAGEGFENRLESSRDSALVGGVVGGAIPIVGSAAGKVAKQFQKSTPPVSADQIKELSTAAYKKADETGGVLKGWFTNRFLDQIKDIEPPTVAGKRVPTDPKLDEALEYVKSFKNTRLTLQDAQNLDEYLGDAIDSFTEFGQVKKSGQKLLDIQRTFRNAIEEADDTLIEGGKEGFEALKDARKLWSQQLKMRDVERIIQRAELTDNPATAIKTGFRNLLTNAKKSKGYNKEQLAAIEAAAKGGPWQDTLKTFGSRLWTIAGGAAGGPLGAIGAQAGSMASRGMATRNALANAENVAKTIYKVSPIEGKSGLPALISSPKSGQLALPAGVATGEQTAPRTVTPTPMPQPALDFNDLIPQQQVGPQSSLIDRIGQAESSGNPNAKNQLSSASGLYQFTDDTWRSAVNKWGRKYGVSAKDKNNPEAQTAMVNELLADNARILKAKGIEPTDANLYFAHFMGAPAAAKAMTLLGKNAIAARSFPQAAGANPKVFFDGRRPRTVDEVYELITSKVA